MNAPSPHRCTAQFDFRSRRFNDDANELARITGRSLAMCRQELFLAEGDVLQARDVLCAGDAVTIRSERLH